MEATYAVDPAQPWRGVGPLKSAESTNGLMSGLETQLGNEARGPGGHVIPVPQGTPVTPLQNDLRGLKGSLALVPTTASGFGQGFSAAPRSDYDSKRLGADPPESAVTLRADVLQSLTAACGVPAALVVAGQPATAMREAWRMFLHGSVSPVAARCAAAIGASFELEGVTFNFDRLFASDISGRARAFQSLVGGGMAVEKAAALAGLMESE